MPGDVHRRSPVMRPALLALVAYALGTVGAAAQVVDLDGRVVDPLEPATGVRATAFVFTTTDCPIANRYAPDIRRLVDEYTRRGIRFRLVFVNPSESSDAIRAHLRTFNYPVEAMTALRDTAHDLVRRLGVTVTPETAIVDPRGRLLYRGRIDDRYTDLGVDRPVATSREFADALAALVQGRPVPTAATRAVGCFVADFRPVTFSADVAPLIHDRCASCHRPTGPAPFSLLTYRDVRQRASQIAAVTARRYMPPWSAETAAGAFVGQKRLSDAEIALLRRWVDDGAVEGDPAHTPPAPEFPKGWILGTPDLVVTLDEPYVLAAGPSDVFRIFVIRLPVSTTTYVTGLEFHPGNPRVVHHANLRLDSTPQSRELDRRDPAPGYDGLMARSAVYPEGHFLGWTPGQVAPLVPPEMAWRLEPGTDLVVQLHLQPSGATERVQPQIGLFFSQTPPTRTPTILRLGSQGIDIAPGLRDYVVRDSYVLPADVELHALQPHAHYRLRQVEGRATLPDGSHRELISIRDWDFRWQHVYRFTTPVRLPRGTTVSMEYVYDNSADNPRNPQVPPQRVFWGQRSFDEMGDLWFQFVAPSDRDRARLADEILAKMTAEDITGYETMLRATPGDAELHDDVALLYLSSGRPLDAVQHFRASLAARPANAATHFNLGTALTVAGKLAEAETEYRAALTLRPGYSSARNNLGTVLAVLERLPEAIDEFRQAVRLDATNVQAQRNLAWYLSTGVSAGPETRREAIAAGERAATLTGGTDPMVLDALAAAYAADGQFARAIEVAERAVGRAQGLAVAAAIRDRLALYRQQRPYRLP